MAGSELSQSRVAPGLHREGSELYLINSRELWEFESKEHPAGRLSGRTCEQGKGAESCGSLGEQLE